VGSEPLARSKMMVGLGQREPVLRRRITVEVSWRRRDLSDGVVIVGGRDRRLRGGILQHVAEKNDGVQR
jgi:hypothetical protein